MGEHDGTAADGDGDSSQLGTIQAERLQHRQYQTTGGQHGDSGGALNHPHRGGQNEGQRDDGQTGVGQHVAKGGTHAGINQHLLEHATGTGNQNDDARRLDGAVADAHHLVTGHAAANTQQIEGGQTGDHDGGEGVTDKLQPVVQGGARLDEATDDGLEADHQQRQADETHGQPEGGQGFAVIVDAVLGIGRQRHIDDLADEVTEQRAGKDQRRYGGDQAEQDHVAEVGTQLGSDQDRARRRNKEGLTGGDTGQQGDTDLHHAAAATADDGEGDTDQQHHGHVKEERQGTDKAGQSHGPVGALDAELAEQGVSHPVESAGHFHHLAKHGTQRHHHGNEAEGAAHPFLDGGGDVGRVHAGGKTGHHGDQNEGDDGVQTSLHHQEEQQHNRAGGRHDQGEVRHCYAFLNPSSVVTPCRSVDKPYLYDLFRFMARAQHHMPR